MNKANVRHYTTKATAIARLASPRERAGEKCPRYRQRSTAALQHSGQAKAFMQCNIRAMARVTDGGTNTRVAQ